MEWIMKVLLAACKTYVDEQIAAIPPFPTGTIIAWHGLFSAIPDGWKGCNGDGGTPDIRGNFLRSAGAGAPNMSNSGSHLMTLAPGNDIGTGKAYSDQGSNIPLSYGVWFIIKVDE